MSSGRLGPPSRAPSCRRRRNDARPPGPDSRSTALPMIACSTASHAAGGVGGGRAAAAVAAGVVVAAGGVVAEPVQLDAQPDQIVQGGRVHLAGHDRGHRRVAGDRGGGVAVQPRAAVATAGRGRGPVPGPLRPDPAGPLLQQRRAALQHHQVGQRHVHQGLDRLPGPLGQQLRR